MRALAPTLSLYLLLPGSAWALDLFGRQALAAAGRTPLGETVRISGVTEAGRPGEITLRVERFDAVAPSARLLVHDGARQTVASLPASRHFRGEVEGRAGSRVVLAVHADGEVRGLLADGEGYASLRSRPGEERLELHRVASGGDAAPFACANDQLPEAEGLASDWEGPAALAEAALAPEVVGHTARVAVETDYEYFQLFGDATAAAEYAVDLLAFSSSIYVDEVETSLAVVSVSLWTSAGDPWAQTSTGCALYEFGKYWNDNRTGVERTIAHFLSGKSNGGGVAWVGVLCSGAFSVDISGAGCSGMTAVSNYGGAYGYTGTIDGDFEPGDPQPIWDTIAVTHEIGHNFASPHTHCYANYGGSSSHVDQCWTSSSSGCYASGAKTLPGVGSVTGGSPGAGNGTIMSYCHLVTGGYPNIGLTLGLDHPYGVLASRVPQRMAAHVASRAGSFPACLAPLAPDAIFSDGFESGGLTSWFIPGT